MRSRRETGATPAQVVTKKLKAILDNDPASFWELAQYEFNVAVQTMSLELMDKVDAGLARLGKKVLQIEGTARKIIMSRDALARAKETQAQFIANSERSEKSLLCQWLQTFVGYLRLPSNTCYTGHALELRLGFDAIDFAYCRYALNVAISSPHIAESKLVASRVHHVLIGILAGANAKLVFHRSPRVGD